MSVFRPCIDLHDGQVKQIVGGTLTENTSTLKTNFIAQQDAAWFASLYKKDNLRGGHIIMLGKGNDVAAKQALSAWPGGLQLGGGMNLENAKTWLDAGAEKIIVTSYLFSSEGKFQFDKLRALAQKIGPSRIVVDLSCRAEKSGWRVAMNRWQTPTDFILSPNHTADLDALLKYCSELLVHAADVEGLCRGVDLNLAEFLGNWGKMPITYAGGASKFEDLENIAKVSNGKIDVTVGSALDLFGGKFLKYNDLISWKG